MTGEAPLRKIVHVDMDAFFASVEQRDDPALRGRPVAVGGSRERGVVAAASYEARAYGVRSAMPSVVAARRCPSLVFVPPRFDVYRAVSDEVRAVFDEYSELVEPVSIDEAYLDVTENIPGLPYATDVARGIRAAVRERTSLTCTAGVSYNKFLAKLASGMNKPDGLTVITPRSAPAIVEALEIGRFHGIGEATERRMHALGIRTGADLRERSEDFLVRNFGKAGRHYYLIARAQDHRTVNPDRERKSVGAERTFDADLADVDEMVEAMRPIAEKLWDRLEKTGMRGRRVTLKVKYSDFRTVGRTRSFPSPVGAKDDALAAAVALLRDEAPFRLGVRLLGISVSGLGETALERVVPDAEQMSLGL